MSGILVTGSNGLIGKALLQQLKGKRKVYAVQRQPPEHPDKDIHYIQLDLTSAFDNSSLPGDVDTIIHLAQSENFRDFPNKADDIFSVNTISTLKLLDYGRERNIRKFIYASSGGIYGNSNKGFDEQEPIIPNKDLGFYLGTKLCSEIIVENYSNVFDTVILRFFFVYGKEQRKSMLIPRLVESIRSGNSITLQGEKGIIINPVHVKDAAAAVERSIELSGSHKINIGGSEQLSLREICECIGDKLKVKTNYTIQEQTPKHLIGDISKMSALLGKPEIKFNEGINDLL